MRVYGTNPVGELLMLTNPRRRKRVRRNPDAWSDWEKEYESASVPKRNETDAEYNARILREYEGSLRKKKGARKVAKKKKKTSVWARLVKSHGVKKAKAMYRKMKAGHKKTAKRRVKKSTVKRHGMTLKPHGRKRKARVVITASRPVKVSANPRRKRRYHRRKRTIMLNPRPRKHYRRNPRIRRHYRRNPRHQRGFMQMRGRKFDVMSVAMIVVGFGIHRVLLSSADKLVKKIPISIVQTYSTDIANILIPLAGYFAFNKVKVTKKLVDRIPFVGKYKNQILVGSYVSAGLVFAKRVFPNQTKWIPFGDGSSSGITLVPNMQGYMNGYMSGGMGGYMNGSPDFLLGEGETADDLGLGSDEFLLG